MDLLTMTAQKLREVGSNTQYLGSHSFRKWILATVPKGLGK